MIGLFSKEAATNWF